MVRKLMIKEDYILDTERISEQVYETDDSIEVYAKNDIDTMYYSKLLTTVEDVEKFNFHSDHWGYEDEYEENAIRVMERIENHIGDKVKVPFENDYITGTLLGMRIDKQYNSHIAIILDEFE